MITISLDGHVSSVKISAKHGGQADWSIDLDRDAQAASYTGFVERDGSSLHQALVAAYGPDVGAEATAEALAYGWENWERLRVLNNPAGYLYRVGQSKAKRGIFRKPPPMDKPIQPDGTHWFEPSLPDAIADLSDKQRAVAILVHGCGWTMTEVAELWGVGLSTVQTHMNRAMRKLRKAMGVDNE